MISSDFATVAFGLASALLWGTGDFSGGLATRRSSLVSVVVVSQGAGLLLLIALALVWSETIPPVTDLLWGSAAGLFGGLGLMALYRALAVGRMGIVAPMSAVVTAALPVLFSAFTEGVPSLFQLGGFGLALIGVWSISRPGKAAAGSPKGLGLALVSGLAFAGFFIFINQAGAVAIFWPLTAARISSFVLMLGIALAAGFRAGQSERRAFSLAVLAGVLDVAANALFVLATQAGRLDVAAVSSSFYPATTVLLSSLVLKERVTRTQAIGITAAVCSIPFLTIS